MAKKDDDGEKRKKGGCFGKLVLLVFFGGVVGLGAGLFFMAQPQDLSDLGGGVSAGAAKGKARDIEKVLEKSIEGDYVVSLSEEDLNLWLEDELSAVQGGVLSEWVVLKRVWVRLEDGFAEVIIEREVMGRAVTVSMFIQVDQGGGPDGATTEIHLHGGAFHESFPKLTRGGRFGEVVVPQGFLVIVLADFKRLAEVFGKEIELGFQRMGSIKIEEGKLILNPKRPSANGGKF